MKENNNKAITLKQFLTSRILIVSILPIVITTIVLVSVEINYLNKQINSDQDLLIELLENNIKKSIVNSTITIEEMKELLENNLIQEEEINKYIDTTLKRNSLFQSIRIIDNEGYITHSPTSEKEIIGFNMANQAFYKSQKSYADTYWTNTFISPETSSVTLAIAVSTHNEEIIIGHYALDELQKIVVNIPIESGYGFGIINSKGIYIANSDYNKVLSRQREKNYELFKENNNHVMNYNNKKMIITTRQMSNPNFTLIVYKSYYNHYSPIIYTFILTFILVIIICLLTIIYSKNQTKHALKAINDLITSTSEVSKGNYNLINESSSFRELNQLVDNFNNMTITIKEMFESLSDAQIELESLNDDLVKQNEEIIKNEKQIRKIINSIYDGVIYLDKKLNILWINNAIYDLFDLSQKNYVMLNYAEVLGNVVGVESKNQLEATIKSKMTLTQEIKFNDKLIEETSTPVLDENNELIGIINTYHNISEKVNLETKLNRAVKMEAIGRLTGGIAHDFNNILQCILGYGELIELELKKDDYNIVRLKERIEIINQTAQKAEELIKKLMIFSKVDTIVPKNLNLNEIIKDISRIINRIIGDDIILNLNLSREIPFIYADKTQMEQIIMNLCVNAKDAMPNGGTININTYVINKDKKEYICLEVEDSGSGINENLKDKIFDPFFTTKELGKGTGLGLATVLGIVEKNNGVIELESEEEIGTTFRIILPSTNIQNEIILPSSDITSKAMRSLTILFAEDNDSVRTIGATILRSAGNTVIEANNGNEAMKKYLQYKDEIDLLVFDLIMPGINGKELYKKIKKINPDIKVVFTTGYDNELVNISHTSENERILQKPYKGTTLLRTLADMLD